MLSSLTDRFRGLGPELIKFAVVGGFCFVLNSVLFNVFHYGLDIGPLTSNSIARVIATAVSYAGNRLWSFSHRVNEESTNARDMAIYAGINVIGLVITYVPIGIVFYGFTEDALEVNIAQIFGTGVATLFGLWAYRRWVFVQNADLAESAALV